ncbi:hypothetical protein EDC01DRAFT_667474 [Geopyxis carbonaria]|nr:hypothetical protein EDC01DRAFT_667474 [Geopyxis carbonaria]
MTTPTTSRQWILNNFIPENRGIDIDADFTLTTSPLPSKLSPGELLIQQTHLSNDPAQRSWIVDKLPHEHYMPPVRPGQVMASFGVGTILATENPDFAVGDRVLGMLNWQDYIVVDPSKAVMPVTKIPEGIDPVDYLALGTTALTAYFGLLRTAGATSSDNVVVVSAAAGATGSVVTQIAKRVLGIKHVWGIVGSDEKCALAAEVGGCDRVFNYKREGWKAEFKDAAREAGGVNVYFDNVGGTITDAVLRNMTVGGRVAMCGAISGYDKPEEPSGVTGEGWGHIIYRALKVEGFLVMQFMKDFGSAGQELGKWAQEGKLQALKTVMEVGFEGVPQGMVRLLKGENNGKLVTKLVL